MSFATASQVSGSKRAASDALDDSHNSTHSSLSSISSKQGVAHPSQASLPSSSDARKIARHDADSSRMAIAPSAAPALALPSPAQSLYVDALGCVFVHLNVLEQLLAGCVCVRWSRVVRGLSVHKVLHGLQMLHFSDLLLLRPRIHSYLLEADKRQIEMSLQHIAQQVSNRLLKSLHQMDVDLLAAGCLSVAAPLQLLLRSAVLQPPKPPTTSTICVELHFPLLRKHPNGASMSAEGALLMLSMHVRGARTAGSRRKWDLTFHWRARAASASAPSQLPYRQLISWLRCNGIFVGSPTQNSQLLLSFVRALTTAAAPGETLAIQIDELDWPTTI